MGEDLITLLSSIIIGICIFCRYIYLRKYVSGDYIHILAFLSVGTFFAGAGIDAIIDSINFENLTILDINELIFGIVFQIFFLIPLILYFIFKVKYMKTLNVNEELNKLDNWK